ncbi:hypothetical protein VXQ18_06555 [Brucella abortus]|nr:hypothetical protein [Brucella abortus]
MTHGSRPSWRMPRRGFGGPLDAFEIMKAYIEAGAAGVHSKTSLLPEKKCGHLGGRF